MKYLPTAITAILAATAVLALMWWAWRARKMRGLAYLPEGVNLTGEPLALFERVYYVATTKAADPLERIAVPGLTYRGYSNIEFYDEGLRVQVDGEPPVDLSNEHISGAGSAQMRIDKVVERGGLTVLRWQSNNTDLESSFRFTDGIVAQQFLRAIDERTASRRDLSHVQKEQE